MSNISNLTYETLLAYVLPAAIVELLFLPLLSDRLNLQWDNASAGYLVLGFISLSIVVGLVFNMWGTVVTTKIIDLQRRKRNLILFGESDKPTILFEYLKTLYPNAKGQNDKIDLVYAIFNFHVAEHIYARRNWDWYFYQSSRNIFATCPFSITGLILLAIQYTWSITTIIGVFLATIVILILVYNFMVRQLEVYYGFYAAVVLGYLLGQLPQTNDRRQPIVAKKKDSL
jgi:hypothetical protein